MFEEGLAPGPVAVHQYLALAADMQGFTSNLPILVLENFNGGMPPADPMQSAFMAIFEQGGGRSSVINAPDLQTRIGLKTRGSSSGGWAKHHFAIEARDDNGQDKDIAPLGMPKDSDWILISAFDFDLALMRNPLVYEISNAAGRYAVRTEFVEVFFNTNGGALSYADHFGVYALAEKITISPDRVDIDQLDPGDNVAPDVTGGYLVKIDRLDPGDSGFGVAGGANVLALGTVAYVDPKEREATSAQKIYISGYFNQAKTALDGPNFADPQLGYAQYLDVESWIDHSWINVLTKNVDAFRLSSYLYKPRNGKIVAGPVWDFDRSMESTDGRDDDPMSWQTTEDDFFKWGWYGRLFQDPNFAQRNVDRWYELRQTAFKTSYITGLISSYQAQLAEAAVRNFQTWTSPAPRGGWQNEVSILRSWLTSRLNWIDAQFQPMPKFGQDGGQIAAPFDLTMTTTKGTIYYTLDGSDPRPAAASAPRRSLTCRARP